MTTLTTLFHYVLIALAALLPIINPPGAAPIFLSLTAGASDATRASLARAVAINCAALLIVAALMGSYILNYFGLSLAVIKIAGGLVIMSTGWQLLRGDHPRASETKAEHMDRSEGGTSFYPLTFPITVGPGSISVAITLGAGARVPTSRLAITFLGMVIGVAIACLAVYVCFRFAARLVRALGDTGTVVMLRLSAFILMAIGVQIMCDGLVERFSIGH